ncbi:hypothetical protein GGQ68_000770 [Sagittula marina]|uniref:FG-GAP repeat domain protein n=1 Tax=Sagittula marina TaxID=943940 RepID=A0A7W6GST9_9RHOB|nr:VCBS repeat-containing protein [Sagittula marina]MBB3984454.1 hypothetical protein [Sagittula marina]
MGWAVPLGPPAQAPRKPWCIWHALTRGACLALALVAGAAAVEAAPCITGARYVDPVTRYGHNVLGGGGEFGGLLLQTEDMDGTLRRVRVTLPDDRVFEDIAPLVSDLGPDGCAEVIVVESQMTRGAQLAIYDGTGTKVAATPHIGQRNRWLSVIGAVDLDGDGAVEIAYIDRPHLAKTLRIWRYTEGRLTEVATQGGLTNHRIGWDFIAGGLRDCGQGQEMVLASGDWRDLVAVDFDGMVQVARIGPYSEAALKTAMDCR